VSPTTTPRGCGCSDELRRALRLIDPNRQRGMIRLAVGWGLGPGCAEGRATRFAPGSLAERQLLRWEGLERVATGRSGRTELRGGLPRWCRPPRGTRGCAPPPPGLPSGRLGERCLAVRAPGRGCLSREPYSDGGLRSVPVSGPEFEPLDSGGQERIGPSLESSPTLWLGCQTSWQPGG
jgi:hypothetical protein